MEKFPEADQLIQLLDTGTGNSYLGPGASLQPAITTTKGHFRTLGTCYRGSPTRQASRAWACTRCAITRPWRGLRPVCTSRLPLICSGTARFSCICDAPRVFGLCLRNPRGIALEVAEPTVAAWS